MGHAQREQQHEILTKGADKNQGLVEPLEHLIEKIKEACSTWKKFRENKEKEIKGVLAEMIPTWKKNMKEYEFLRTSSPKSKSLKYLFKFFVQNEVYNVFMTFRLNWAKRTP